LADGSTIVGKPLINLTVFFIGLMMWTVAVLMNWKNSTNSVNFLLSDVGFASADATDVVKGTSMGHISTS
jgi:hypothetical protein